VENKIVDQFSDPSFLKLSRILRKYPEAKQYIQKVRLDEEENEKRADVAFADRDNRKFPIDDPGQAALSRYYMEKQAGVSEDTQRNCATALAVFGIELELVEKTAAAPDDDSDYLLPGIRRFRIKTAEDVKLAAEAIQRNRRRMDTDSKAQASTNLIKKAVEFNVKLPSQILKFAGATACDTRKLRDWVEARTVRTTDPSINLAYVKLAEEVDRLPLIVDDRVELIKVASTLSELDEAAGLRQYYDRTLLDPLSTVFNTEKVAVESLELAGRPIPLEDLLAVPAEVYQDVFGGDLAAEFTDPSGNVDPEQLKIILPTVPYDLQKTLAAQLGV